MSAPNDDPRLTRRQVLGGVAMAGAASLARPATDLAATIPGARVPAAVGVGSLDGESAPVAAPCRFTLVGISWSGPDAARIELRTRARGSGWSRWVLASALGHDPDGRTDRSTLFGEPVWAGCADHVQLRSGQAVRGVRLYFVRPAVGATAARAHPAMALARPLLDAGPGQPPVIARAAWAQGHAPPAVRPHYGAIKLAFVHHSVTANGYGAGDVPDILLSIFDYHRYVRGFWDIAYNFAIDAFGRIWEGRAGGIDEPVIGAHAGGYNQESTGVVVLGSFSSAPPSSSAVRALERLLAWKLSLHGVPAHGRVTVVVSPSGASFTPFAPGARVSLPRVAGHRDGDSTDCPGSAFYAELPSIRPRISALAGTPARVALSAPGGTATAGVALVVSGHLGRLGGPPMGGAPVEVQRVGPARALTIASATTAADGSWSVATALSANAALRALHRPKPATVSELVAIEVAPALTLAVDSVSPLTVSGTVLPSKPKVTIDVHVLANGRERLVKSKRVAVRGSSFATGVQLPGPGRYALQARTDADAGNAAGSSAVVQALV